MSYLNKDDYKRYDLSTAKALSTKVFDYVDNFSVKKEKKSILVQGNPKSKVMLSIIITTFSRPEYLENAIKSALNQGKWDNYEIIIMDNEGRPDIETETQKLVRKYECDKILYYKNEENLGQPGNYNRGVELANGKWITILNDDDILYSNFVSTFIRSVKQYPAANGLKFNFDIVPVKIDKNGNVVRDYARTKELNKEIYGNLDEKFRDFANAVLNKIPKENYVKLKPQDYLWDTGATVSIGICYKKSCFMKCGGFDTVDNHLTYNDALLNVKFIKKYGMYNLFCNIGQRRLGGNAGATQESQNMVANAVWYYDKALLKRYKPLFGNMAIHGLLRNRTNSFEFQVKESDLRMNYNKIYNTAPMVILHKGIKACYYFFWRLRQGVRR